MSLPLRPSLAPYVIAIASFFATAAGAQDFPIVIDHAFGSTTITEKPTRVATVAWANHEVPLALGIVPVGMARANFGDDDGDGVLPWVADRLDELKAEVPVLFDEGDGIDFEAVAATAPQVILAAYSGLSRADYDTLSNIAPVVPYETAPWSTSWRDMIRLNAAGLGMVAEGDALIDRIEGEIAQKVAAYPEIAGKTAMFIIHLDVRDLSVIRFYSENDTRVQFLSDIGLASPRAVQEASQPGQFAGEISAERIDTFDDVDIIVTYGGQPLLDRVKSNLLTAHLPSVRNGAVVLLGNNPVGTSANPTPLSITAVLDEYLQLLSTAAQAVE
ncbi:iron-siderophore ABC transporter substrate-binding protein [Arenibacterium halophilum]|uniref:iron-siderophore ABC transporter substrate-binding protein n=1 Tax=Arenibacterium halophilum TaxID=2583821 RepID=UPI00148643C8